MAEVVFRYRSRELDIQDINFIQDLISKHYTRGRSYISCLLCETWQWVQPNGKLKEYAARDLLLRLEENGFIELPPRLRPKNNLKQKSFSQVPLFLKKQISGLAGEYADPQIQIVSPEQSYLWEYLIHHYHYLGLPKLVGEHLRHFAFIDGQVVACLAWASSCMESQSPGPVHWLGGARQEKKSSPDCQQYPILDTSLGPGQISGFKNTISQCGAINAWDTFMTLSATAKKLGINSFNYLYDHISGALQIPALADIISQRAQEFPLGTSWDTS